MCVYQHYFSIRNGSLKLFIEDRLHFKELSPSEILER